MKHGRCSRGGPVTQRRPGMEGPKGNENSKTEEEQGKNKLLRAESHRTLLKLSGQLFDIKCTRVPAEIERSEANQCNQCAKAKVKSDVEGGIVAILTPAP